MSTSLYITEPDFISPDDLPHEIKNLASELQGIYRELEPFECPESGAFYDDLLLMIEGEDEIIEEDNGWIDEYPLSCLPEEDIFGHANDYAFDGPHSPLYLPRSSPWNFHSDDTLYDHYDESEKLIQSSYRSRSTDTLASSESDISESTSAFQWPDEIPSAIPISTKLFPKIVFRSVGYSAWKLAHRTRDMWYRARWLIHGKPF